MMESPDPREEKALGALAAAVLHPFEPQKDVSEEEALLSMADNRALSDDEQRAVTRIKFDPCKTIRGKSPDAPSVREIASEGAAAMHREKGVEELSSEAIKAIDDQRQAVREKLRRKRNGA